MRQACLFPKNYRKENGCTAGSPLEKKMLENNEVSVETGSTKKGMLDDMVLMEIKRGRIISDMTQEAYIGKIIADLDSRTQVWSYVDEKVIAITANKQKSLELMMETRKICSQAPFNEVSGEGEIETLKKELSKIRKKIHEEDAKYEIEKLGGHIENGSCILAENDNGSLKLDLFIDKKRGSRFYQIIEKWDGKEWGSQCKDNCFSTEDITQPPKIDAYLKNRLGDYSMCCSSISKICCIVENNRLLSVDFCKIINGDVLNTEEVFEAFKCYIEKNIGRDEIVAIKTMNDTHVGIGASATKTASKNFDDILQKIAPYNNARSVKSELKRKGLLKCDNTDYQKTIAGVHNTFGDKIYSFKFDDAVLKQIYNMHKKHEDEKAKAVTALTNETKSE